MGGGSIPTPPAEVSFKMFFIQRYFTKRIEGLFLLPNSQRLRVLKLSSLEHRRIIVDQSFLINIFVGDINVDFASIFNILPPTVTRFHNMRLLRPHTNYKSTDQTFTVRVV